MPRLLPQRFGPECVREFDLAADERYSDAQRLAAAGRRTGAIYLFGYVAEMLLKSAYFRLIGYDATRLIGTTDMWLAVGPRANSTARVLGLPGAANLHDLTAWVTLLVTYRASHHLVYPEPEFAVELLGHVRSVHVHWTEALRYHKNTAYAHELHRVRTACGWLIHFRENL